MIIDSIRLKHDLRNLQDQLRAQKRLVRTTPTPWTTNLVRPLLALKAQATLLCAIQAHRRGRLHLRRCVKSHAHLGLPRLEALTLDDQARFIGERWAAYSATVEVA
jgi:hypothetical protein